MERYCVIVGKPLTTFLPEQAGYCLFSHSIYMSRLSMNYLFRLKRAPTATALEGERTGNMPSWSATAASWCLEVEEGVQRKGSWLELGACVLGNPLLTRWEKITDWNEHGNRAGSVFKGRKPKKEQLVWPWSGNISFRAEQQKRTRNSTWWNYKDCLDFMAFADTREVVR